MENTKELQSLGHAAGMYQQSPKLIAAGLKLAAVEKASTNGEPIRDVQPALMLNGVSYYPAADIVGAIAALARYDAEKLQEESRGKT